jgi:phosphoenolpyruvate-protein kinase (PTS system EI component)
MTPDSMISHGDVLLWFVIILGGLSSALIVYIWNDKKNRDKRSNESLSQAIDKLAETLESIKNEILAQIHTNEQDIASVRLDVCKHIELCRERYKHCPHANPMCKHYEITGEDTRG